MSGEWQLAPRRWIRAIQGGELLVVMAGGVKPSPCYHVKVERSLLPVEPPEFMLQWMQGPGFCPREETPYRIVRTFHVGERRETILVHHAHGTEEVRLRAVSPILLGGPAAEALAAGESTGYSDLSFDEAYRDAVSRIPIRHPDELLRVSVVASGGVHGGIAGIDQVFVTVRRDDTGYGADGPEGAAAEPEPCRAVYRAQQVPGEVIILAEGEHPTGGYRVFWEMLPIKIWPPQFRLVHEAPTGRAPDVVTPFWEDVSFRAAEKVDRVVVHDADGEHEVEVEQVLD